MRRGSQARTTFYVVVATALAIVLLSFGRALHFDAARGFAGAAFEPVQAVLAQAGRDVRGFIETVTSIGDVERENRDLKKQVADLQRQLAQAGDEQVTDRELKAMLGLQQSLGVRTVGAEVIGRDPEGLSQVVTVGAGRARGVKVGMIALGLRGLVGRVVRVGPNSSQVQLVSDPDSPVNVLLASSHVGGTLQVENGRMSVNIPAAPIDLKVPSGEALMTSGLGGNYPKGIPVGRITDYHYQAYGVAQVAAAEPLDNLARLEYVTIDLDFTPVGP